MVSEKKIKIGVLTTISKTMDWFIVPSMRNLSQNGYDVTLISNMEDGFKERNSDFAKCIHLPMSRGASIKDIFKSIPKLVKIFKQEKFDVIYYMTPNASMYASIAGALAGVKIRIYNQCGIRYVTLTGLKRFVFKMVEKITCMFSTHVKAVSFKNKDFAISEGLCRQNKISVVGIGGTIGVEINLCCAFDKEKIKAQYRENCNVPNDAFVYGYVGRINKDKGINELIEAFKDVFQKVNNAYLVLVGMLDDANPIDEENLEFARTCTNIVMTGNVPANEVYYYMSMFDVLTHPTYREGFGKVLQEAMGVGVPIITTNVPGPSEVIEDNISGILCNAQDSRDLKEKMILIYENEEMRNNFAKAGFERAKKFFDRPIMLNNILNDMNEIMNVK